MLKYEITCEPEGILFLYRRLVGENDDGSARLLSPSDALLFLFNEKLLDEA